MTLLKRVLLFLKKVQDSAEKIDVITYEMMQSWQQELSGLLKNENKVVNPDPIYKYLKGIVKKQLTRKSLQKNFKGNTLNFTRARLTENSQKYLDERVMFSVSLIQHNREQQVNATLKRFAGWLSAIPTNSVSEAKEKPKEAVKDIIKPLIRQTFEERRVLIDQGHKLSAAVNEAIAQDQGAICVEWHSHWQEVNYNYRKTHKERDRKLFFYKDNYFVQNGYIKKDGIQYINDIDGFGQEPFCRCYGTYFFTLYDIPESYLTKKGKDYING
ncbi:hypothetical protein [Commensalibacter nepenthis]|uniref:Phage head morphogenesis domain-containing protein n=1 Tax=Commensalibacter nepenthis TaxID=3043872 RepID=A0ABT6Q838_9PROT|nr:hypothetical protein [Commensalibacter sp. TBRC 10068]MDI2113061.1 hypothetical protein [Commensalibacter sp. TBRC 10068]